MSEFQSHNVFQAEIQAGRGYDERQPAKISYVTLVGPRGERVEVKAFLDEGTLDTLQADADERVETGVLTVWQDALPDLTIRPEVEIGGPVDDYAAVGCRVLLVAPDGREIDITAACPDALLDAAMRAAEEDEADTFGLDYEDRDR